MTRDELYKLVNDEDNVFITVLCEKKDEALMCLGHLVLKHKHWNWHIEQVCDNFSTNHTIDMPDVDVTFDCNYVTKLNNVVLWHKTKE